MRLVAKWWATLQESVSSRSQHPPSSVPNVPLNSEPLPTSLEEPLRSSLKRTHALVETAAAGDNASSQPSKRQQRAQGIHTVAREEVTARANSMERNVHTAGQGPIRTLPADPLAAAAQVASTSQVSKTTSSRTGTHDNVITGSRRSSLDGELQAKDQRQHDSDSVPGVASTSSTQTPHTFLSASGPSVRTTLDRRPKDTNGARASAPPDTAISPNPVTAKAPSANGKEPAKPRSAKLKDITFGISDQANSVTLKQMRDRYYEALLSTKVIVKLRNSPSERAFTVREATELSNFFFEEMLGPSALKRLQKLVQEYNRISTVNDGVGLQHISKAANAATDEKVPLVFQEFFQAFQQEQRNRIRTDGSVFALHSLGLSLTTHDRYLKLLDRMNTDQSCVEALSKLGFKISSGRGFKSVVREYLCATLDISDEILKKSLEPSNGLSVLVDCFGYGILTILPPTFVHR